MSKNLNTTNNREDKKDKRKERTIIAILLLLLLLLVTGGLGYIRHLKDRQPVVPGTVTIQNSDENKDKNNPLKGLYVTYSGITDNVIVEQSTVELENLKENGDIVMKFEVYEKDKLIYETDYIKSNTHVNWEAGKDLSKGEHTLRIVQIPQIKVDDKWVPLTSGTCECVLTRQ